MRSQSVIGLVLIVVGVMLLAVRSFTYFTEETVVGPLGFFAWDVERPHTVFISPIAGLIAAGAGIVLALAARKRSSA